MSKYTGYECKACGEKFTDDDDVVVCPECGTPYHRECYLKNGKCINEELHEKGESWQEDQNGNSGGFSANGENEEENTSTRCPRCGYTNTPDKLFCEKCGMPLITPSNSVPFNENPGQNNGENGQGGFNENNPGGMPFENQAVYNQDSVIDGVRLGDFARYVGSNAMSFLSKFIRFGKFGGKISMNIPAFLFPQLYFFYRKMNKWGVLFMIISALLTIPSMILVFATGYMGVKFNYGFDINSKMFTYLVSLSVDLRFAIEVLAGIFANFIYYKQAKRDINSIYAVRNPESPEEVKDEIASKGGISWTGVIVGFTVFTAITSIGTFLITFIK